MAIDGRARDDGEELPARGLLRALLRGACRRCPACGEGPLYRAYLKPVDRCRSCREELSHHRTDDAPPYVTIFVIGHVVVAAALGVDIAYEWPVWLHTLVWLPVTAGLCLGFLPVVKGAMVGLQWALRMHGFGDAMQPSETHPALAGRAIDA